MFGCYPWEACPLLKGNRGGMDVGEREGREEGLREEEGEETVVKM